MGQIPGWANSFLRDKKGLSFQSERPGQVDEIENTVPYGMREGENVLCIMYNHLIMCT